MHTWKVFYYLFGVRETDDCRLCEASARNKKERKAGSDNSAIHQTRSKRAGFTYMTDAEKPAFENTVQNEEEAPMEYEEEGDDIPLPEPPAVAEAPITVESTRSTTQNWADLKSARRAKEDTNPWDDTPHRSRPPALRGLLVRHLHWREEPAYTTGWQRDESIYNKKYDGWSEYDGHFYLGAEGRSEYLPERMKEKEERRTAYLARWNAKFE